MINFPLTVKIALVMLLVNALVWLAFGLIILFGLHPALPQGGFYRWSMAAGSIFAAVILAVLIRLLRKRVRIAWYLVVIGLFATVALILFDDIGWIDLSVLAVAFLPMVLLLVDRKWYLGNQAS